MKEDQNEIFGRLKSMLKSLCPPLECRTDKPGVYGVYGKKKVITANKEFDGMYFASAVIQKNFVGFYFFPVYTHRAEFGELPPVLKKCMKGKSCFYIKKIDDELFKQINKMLKKGIGVYKKAKWA